MSPEPFVDIRRESHIGCEYQHCFGRTERQSVHSDHLSIMLIVAHGLDEGGPDASLGKRPAGQ
jgi:hypothetical protein